MTQYFGKTLVYQIPALAQNTGITVVIEPLIALMHDQVDHLRALEVDVAYLDSTQSKTERKAVLKLLRNQQLRFLYVTPEQVEADTLFWIEDLQPIQMIVVDEAHCVTAWGSTFREAYLSIGTAISDLKHHPVVVALSATALPEDRPQITELLSMRHPRVFAESLYRSNLSLMKLQVTSRKEQQKALKRYIRKYHENKTIVFCNTIKAVEAVADYLDKLYPDEVISYHSRDKKNEKAMLRGEKHIIVATSALSMGVDIRNVDLVIHFNMPLSLADYYQMAGRAGREGQAARSILLYNPDDYNSNYGLLENIQNKSAWKRAVKLLDDMKDFCEDTEHCMVQTVLRALGDDHETRCRYCTNCQKGR